jgi:fimbrial chaperone protein
MGRERRWRERRALCHHPAAVRHAGKKENTLRIIDDQRQLPQDRETLFWMNVKAIPRWINQSSAITRCSWRLSAASSSITARQTGAAAGSGGGKAEVSPQRNTLTLINPPLLPDGHRTQRRNPGAGKCAGPADGEASVKLPSDAGREITYRTINDYGALTPRMKGVMQ